MTFVGPNRGVGYWFWRFTPFLDRWRKVRTFDSSEEFVAWLRDQ